MIEPKGSYYTFHDGYISRNIKPIPKSSKKICDFVLDVLPSCDISLDDVHSLYIKGSRAYSEDSNTDIDFTLISEKLSRDDVWIEDPSEIMPESPLQKCVKKEFGIDIDCVVGNIQQFDALDRFQSTCIYGEDLSSTSIPLSEIPFLWKSQPPFIDPRYIFKMFDMVKWFEDIFKNQISHPVVTLNIKFYIKNCLRYTFLTTNLGVYTRDLYWCYYFIKDEYPEFSAIVKRLLEIYLILDHDLLQENLSLVMIPINDSKVLLEHCIKCIRLHTST